MYRYIHANKKVCLFPTSTYSYGNLPFFLCPRPARHAHRFSTAALSFFFLPFFFVFFIHVKFLRSRFSLLRVLSVSRIQTNVYVWVPISIKTFPRRAAANHPSPFAISSPHHATPHTSRLPPPPPREPVTSVATIFKTYVFY